MTRRLVASLSLLFVLVGCGGKSSTSPSPTPTPTPTTFTLTGQVTDNATGQGLGGATVTVIDGPNQSRSGNTDGSGNYSIGNLTQGGFTARATKQYYTDSAKGVTLTSNQAINFSLASIPPFSAKGTGDNVFTIPSSVTRINISATYTRFSSNFIVYINGSLIVNELIGTGWGTTSFSGTYLTNGGTVQITDSSGVAWTFTEVR